MAPAASTIGQLRQLLEQRRVVGAVNRGVRVERRDAHRHERRRLEAEIDGQDLREAADHQRRAEKQHDGDRDFGRDEQPSAARGQRRSALPVAFRQRGRQAAPRQPQRREQPEGQPGERREREAEEQDGDVDRHRRVGRQLQRDVGDDRVQRQPRETDARARRRRATAARSRSATDGRCAIVPRRSTRASPARRDATTPARAAGRRR